jgi:G:T/U-mismatch repair DNA glycosylase
MSDIPKARGILTELAHHLAPEHRATVEHAIDLMHRRRPSKPVAPAKKRSVDADLAEEIRGYVANHPRAHLQDVAVRYGTNIGRVSEALRHER